MGLCSAWCILAWSQRWVLPLSDLRQDVTFLSHQAFWTGKFSIDIFWNKKRRVRKGPSIIVKPVSICHLTVYLHSYIPLLGGVPVGSPTSTGHFACFTQKFKPCDWSVWLGLKWCNWDNRKLDPTWDLRFKSCDLIGQNFLMWADLILNTSRHCKQIDQCTLEQKESNKSQNL